MATTKKELTPWQQLAEPLPKDEIKLRIGRVTPKGQQAPYSDGTKAEFLAYHDARHVMERLDEVFGPEKWTDTYRELPAGSSVECTLSVMVADGVWVSKTDVGYPNNPKTPEPEALKSSYSDALKRAGVKWGIGRYLYSLPKSGWWPVSKWGELSAADEKKVRARMFDGLAVEAPMEDAPTEPEPEPTTEKKPEVELMTDAQRRKIQVLAKALGYDADLLHGRLLIETGKNSSKELTMKEASAFIDALQKDVDAEASKAKEATGE